MTNFEWLTRDKMTLATFLDLDECLWQRFGDWWCTKNCPHQVNGVCKYDECIDEHTSLEVALMWLDAEHDDV